MYEIFILFLVLLIGVANLALGYAVTALLGIGPRTQEQLQRALAPRRVMVVPSQRVEPPEETDAVAGPDSATPPPVAAQVDKDAVMARCGEILEELHRSDIQMANLDDRLRLAVAEPAAEATAQFAELLSAETYLHLERLNRAIEPLLRYEGSERFLQIRTQAQACVDLAVVETNTTLADLEEHATAEIETRLPHLASSLERIRETCCRMRDLLEESVAGILLAERKPEAIEARLKVDRFPKIASRLGWEIAFAAQQADPEVNMTSHTAVLFDLDHLTKIVGEYGVRVGDCLLENLAGKVGDQFKKDTTVARIMGRRFLLLCCSRSVDDAAQSVEQVRQSLEHTEFRDGDDSFACTTCAAVVAIQEEDTVELLLERLEMTLQEAKNYGRNRTFVCETDCPVPVNPPKLSIEKRAIYLQ
ncbi:GGDEF domain-containing protein [Lignipirellula cremea]|uniref:Diguanylate cyclase n=1 Tax=Lignipirellula cremea TaxID=2528010 RepID=A0A518DVX4_9BACT|nr:diguanylate cyclase [Lignipirellula cremea]QDU95973.1 diguanylate cyclase [Lignipirellula cremea]